MYWYNFLFFLFFFLNKAKVAFLVQLTHKIIQLVAESFVKEPEIIITSAIIGYTIVQTYMQVSIFEVFHRPFLLKLQKHQLFIAISYWTISFTVIFLV